MKIPDKAREEYQKGMVCLVRTTPLGCNHFKKAIKVFPDYYEALSSWDSGIHLGRKEEARKAFQAAIDLSKGKHAAAELDWAISCTWKVIRARRKGFFEGDWK